MFTIYCSKCGEELPEGTKFCTKCGAPVNLETKTETVVQNFEKDPQLQDHWIKRGFAYIIDAVIVGIISVVILFIALLPFYLVNLSALVDVLVFPFASGLFLIFYSALMESTQGATVGKNLMGLKVVTQAGGTPNFEKAFIRNLSKIHPVLLLLDVVGGLITSTDLHQKYSDKIANTKVV